MTDPNFENFKQLRKKEIFKIIVPFVTDPITNFQF